jgi:Coenzyme PQQ synthesis protein D (PqqD)
MSASPIFWLTMSSQSFKVTASEIHSTAVITSTQNQLSSQLADEVVILNLDSGIYYGLNEVGARIWELVQQPRSFAELHSILLEEYDVDSDACQQDLTNILLDLRSRNLVEVSDEASS